MTPRLNGRLTRTIGGILAVALATGCTDFLKASNPSAIQADDLANPLYINLMVNGVIGEYQQVIDDLDLRSGVFGDELFNNHGFFEEREIDKRNVIPENGTYPLVIYVPLQRARFLADSVAGRLKTLLGDSASKDLRVARVLAYAGSSYDLLAENLCSIPVNGSAPYTPEETISKFAIPRLNEAIAVATAYKAATTNTTLQAAADSVINFAKLTAARSLLFVNDKAGARAFAVQVPATFEFRAYYSAQNARENNAFQNAAVGSPWVSMEPKNKRLNDPRVPHLVTPSGVQSLAAGNADTVTINGVRTIGAFIPKSTLMHSTYDGTTTGAVYTLGPNYIRIATYLEAQYIIAEADGPVASTLTFVNSRRAVGGQTAVTLAGAALMDELREQRRRDFFLDGHRLGDMRRYLKYDKIDNFPRGPYPGSISGEQFNDATCWPLPLSEIAGNPNVPRG
jgi:hypothetical protein